MGISFPTNRRMPNIMWLLTLIASFSMCPIVSSQFDTFQKLVGENITFICAPSSNIPDNYPIFWFRESRKKFIINDERFSVNCTRGHETDRCFLTIRSLRTDDSDTYVCEYHNGLKYTQIGGKNLEISYGRLPSDDSPVCEIYEAANNGHGYFLSDANKVFKIGDEIFLWCAVSYSDIKPSLSWIRKHENDMAELTPYITGRSLFQPVNLTEMDEGAVFACYMNHPALSETRSCSIIPLPTPPTTQTTVIVIILIIVVAVVIVLAIALTCLMNRRRKNNVTPSKTNCEITYERQPSITEGFVAVNTPDPIDLSRDHKDAKKHQHETSLITTNPSLPKTTTTTRTTNKEDRSLLYAKSDKRSKLNSIPIDESSQYEKVPSHVTSEVGEENESGNRLIYADLELDEVPDYDPPRISVISKDATVYADIKETQL